MNVRRDLWRLRGVHRQGLAPSGTYAAQASRWLLVVGNTSIFQTCIIQKLLKLVLDAHLKLPSRLCVGQMEVP